MLKLSILFLFLSIYAHVYHVESKLIGALYTATNLNSSNSVQIYAIDDTGALSYTSSLATGGLGSSSTGGDSLFSQDSIAVQGNYLFVVNAGSNTLSLFSISPSNPTSISLIMSSSTSGSFGLQYPIAVSVNPMLPITCVLSGGANNGVVCFTYSATALTPINGLLVQFNQAGLTTPPNGPKNTFSDLSWTDDGTALVVSYKGFSADAPGYVLSYRVTGTTAATSIFGAQQNTTIPGAVGPFSITPIGTFGNGATAGNAFFVTDPLGTSIDTFSIVKSTAVVTGGSSTVIPTAGICWSEVSPSTNSYVAIGRGFSQLTFSDSLAVTVTNSVSFPGGVGGIDSTIVTINRMDFLFVLSPGNSSLFVYSLPTASTANYIGSYPITSASVKHQGLSTYIMAASPSSSSSSSSSTGSSSTSAASPTTTSPSSSSSSSSTGSSKPNNHGQTINPNVLTVGATALVLIMSFMTA